MCSFCVVVKSAVPSLILKNETLSPQKQKDALSFSAATKVTSHQGFRVFCLHAGKGGKCCHLLLESQTFIFITGLFSAAGTDQTLLLKLRIFWFRSREILRQK